VIELSYDGGKTLATVPMKERFTFAFLGSVSQELLD
jgi:hypothetical protein